MLKILSSIIVISALTVVEMPLANASSGSALATHKKAGKKHVRESQVAKETDEKEPDTSNAASTDFNCELGNKLTIYQDNNDDQHIGLRWKQRVHRLTRVNTSTGANRFENQQLGLVWIGIPAKGILLDSKKGLQLANECKNAGQTLPAHSEIPSQPKS